MPELALDLLTKELQTRFKPAVYDGELHRSDGAALEAPPKAADWPLPPPALRFAHNLPFVQTLWQYINGLLSQPTSGQILRGGANAVQVLGTAVFLRTNSGQIHTFLWNKASNLELAESHLVMVTEVPYGHIWLRLLVSLAIRRRCNLPRSSARVKLVYSEEYVDWLVKVMLKRVQKHFDLSVVRRHIAQGLGIDADTWRLCHHLQVGSPLDGKASIKQYNLCVRHKAELLEVEAVAPRVVGIYALLCERLDFPSMGEPTQRLREYLRRQGLSSRVWRLTLRNGSRLLPLLRQFYYPCGADAVLDCLKVMEGIGALKVPPTWLSQALFAEWGNAGARRSSYCDRMAPSMPNLRHFVSCALVQFPHCPSDAEEEQIAEVVHWLTEPKTRALTRTQRQGGWHYLAREARSYHRLQEEQAEAHLIAWDTPFKTLDVGNVCLVALANSQQLLEEGRRMRNCAASWQERCIEGMKLLVSAREQGGHRIATVSYAWSGDAWRFDDAKGPMNRPLDSKLMHKLQSAAALIPSPLIAADEAIDGAAGGPRDLEPRIVKLVG